MTTILPEGVLTPSKYGTEAEHKKIAGSGFLPRLQLLGASTNLCKKGKAPIGSYAILRGKDTIVHQFGDEVNILVLGWRPKAVRFGGKQAFYYNPQSPEYKKIEIDSTKQNSHCMYGPEYLVYVPQVDEIVTFHFNNPTMRTAASGMLPNLGKAVTCKIELIEKPDNSWHGPVILNCSTPLTPPGDLAAFQDRVKMELAKFNNPKESELEAVEEGDEAAPQRDR
jgi:hypothetical protein